MPPCPPKWGFVLEHKHTTFKNENEPTFRGIGGQKQREEYGLGAKGKTKLSVLGQKQR